MIAGILFFPKIKIGKLSVDTYWVVALAGALSLVICGQNDFVSIGKKLAENSAVNPLKIVALFISMTILSVYLDEAGFFSYLAAKTLSKAKSNKKKLFLYLYIIVSVLTVFTSNDIIILSFTPFICYFSKNAKINPLPFLAAEFVAANTWSMALIIGNPTNIYLATANGINFLSYFKIMALPTLVAGVTAYAALRLLFNGQLKESLQPREVVEEIKDKPAVIFGVVMLAGCTVLLAIASYIGWEMWLIAVAFAAGVSIGSIIMSLLRKKSNVYLNNTLKRAPWQLIPFVVSMFVMIITLSDKGATQSIAAALGGGNAVEFKYGIAAFLAANVVNNIPMSVLFCEIIKSAPASVAVNAVYATVIGSNICAFFTPVGALAGIMFGNILSRHGIKFGYLKFLKLGLTVALPTLLLSLATLAAVLNI